MYVRGFLKKTENFMLALMPILIISLLTLLIVLVLRLVFINLGLQTDATACMTLLLALVTGGVIWWQGKQLKKQLELQTLTELYKEWNGKEMRKARCALCSVLPFDYNADNLNFDNKSLDKTEGVLEFLERIASYHREKVLTIELVWATIGFYIERYYHYTHKAIPAIRKRWQDVNLYEDIEIIYEDLMKMNLDRRKAKGETISSKEDIKKQFDNEIDQFKRAECQWTME